MLFFAIKSFKLKYEFTIFKSHSYTDVTCINQSNTSIEFNTQEKFLFHNTFIFYSYMFDLKMHNNLNKKKKSKVVKTNSNVKGPDEKKTKLEDVHQTAFSFLTTSNKFNYHNFVKMNMNNSLKRFDNNSLDKLKNLDKQGNNFYCLNFE